MGGARLFQSIVRGDSKFFNKYGHSNDDVQDLRDEASFPLETLNVLKGDAFLKIDAERCSRQQAIALARKALARM